eukprot:9172417-Alexandrium_andersonii.AAC.1
MVRRCPVCRRPPLRLLLPRARSLSLSRRACTSTRACARASAPCPPSAHHAQARAKRAQS